MASFWDTDLRVHQIVNALHVPAGVGRKVHRSRPSHGLAFHLSGEKDYLFDDGKTLTVRPSSIIYLPKGSSYNVASRYDYQAKLNCYAINFDLSEDVSFPPFAMEIKNHLQMEESFRQAQKAWLLKPDGYVFKCRSELYSILCILYQEHGLRYTPDSRQEKIRPAMDCLMHQSMDEWPDVAKLAELCHMTPEYFRKIFKGVCGSSPLHYMNQLKLSRARELIDSRVYSMAEVALLTGFSDPCHFSRAFKKAFGVCPSEYAETVSE